MMLTTILTPEARERLHRVAIVKPDSARAVEEHLLKIMRTGRLQSKVGYTRVRARTRVLAHPNDQGTNVGGVLCTALQVSEDEVIRILDEVAKAEAAARGATKVTITRKKRVDDDDDDDDDF